MVHCEPFPTPTDRIQVHRTAQDDATSSSRFGTCTASLVPTIVDPFIANCCSTIFPVPLLTLVLMLIATACLQMHRNDDTGTLVQQGFGTWIRGEWECEGDEKGAGGKSGG